METPLPERYRAAMLLSAAGDALGYRGSRWEYCKSGPQILEELAEIGGLGAPLIAPPEWPVSDDTVLHLATAEALVECPYFDDEAGKEALFQKMAAGYVAAMLDMDGRKPGPTSILGTSQLRPGCPGGYRVPFNSGSTGCGAAMRAMCIGLRFPRKEQLGELVEVSVVSGKMTHNHPTGYLGAVASAVLVSCAVRGDAVETWGATLVASALPTARRIVAAADPESREDLRHWGYFGERWESYLRERNLPLVPIDGDHAAGEAPLSGVASPRFPADHGCPAARDEAYRAWSLSGWAGRSGHDAPIIAYDAVLTAEMHRRGGGGGGDGGTLEERCWEKLCQHAMFHGGDSDSTGVIAGACWGALLGMEAGVPPNNHSHLEYRHRLVAAADSLYRIAWPHAETHAAK